MIGSVPSARLLSALKASLDEKRLVCKLCRPQRLKSRSRSPYSTISPATTINAQATIPQEYRKLYDKLIAFGKASSVYVNISQLRLALKDLESRKSTTRIAVLGVNDAAASRRLIQALLADPLSSEASWEEELQGIRDDGKPLLIRAGIKTSLDSSSSIIRTLTIPSAIIDQHRIELLISQIDFENRAVNELTEAGLSALLSPSLHPQQSSSGRASAVTYPVHKTILLENGFHSVLGLANVLQSAEGKTATSMIQIVSNVNWTKLPASQYGVVFVDLDKAQHAIQAFRESLQNSTTYEHEWLASGLPVLNTMILSANMDDTVLKPTTRNLIDHILTETTLAIDVAETDSIKTRTDQTVPEATREHLQKIVGIWAEQAHTEFQEEVTNIVQSNQWRRLAWWKLLWRIDEVEMLASDAIRRTYLIEAEKNAMYLGGRLAQAGLIDKSTLPVADEQPKEVDTGMKAINFDVWSRYNAQPWNTFNQRPPFLSLIGVSRMIILQVGIPPFAVLAQRYLLSALSFTGLTSFASILAYVSSLSTGFYEAGTIAAVGFIASTWRLQSRWERARTAWINHIWAEGKRALDAMEKELRRTIREGGRKIELPEEAIERENARAAIMEVKDALAEIPDAATGSKA